MPLRVFRWSGSLVLLLTLCMLISNASLAHASARISTVSPQQAGKSGVSRPPAHVSTMTAPHRPEKPFGDKDLNNPPAHFQPTPSSGAKILKPAHRSDPGPRTVGTSSFTALGQGSNPTPSDSNADIGPNNVLETVNEEFAIYDRSGNLQYNNTFAGWFGTSAFDPDVIYDPWGARFAFLVDTGSSILISVAQQTNALGNYCNYTFSIANFPDYPRIGFDETYLYFTVNDYVNGNFGYSVLFQINLQQMESCGTTNWWEWDHITDPNGNQAFNVVPALKYSFNTSHDEEYLIDTIFGGACNVTEWRINNHLLFKNSVNTECYSTPPDASQAGSTATIPASANGKILHQVTYRDNLLDFSLTTSYNWGGGNVKAIIAWLKLDPVALTVSQQGLFGNPSYWFFFPALVQDSNGKTMVVFNSSNSSIDPSIWYIAQNTDGSLQSTLALAWGSSANSSGRWGDYQSARLDPTDVTHIWICGQYAASGGAWGTAIGDTAAS